jgi:hypothetical protein
LATVRDNRKVTIDKKENTTLTSDVGLRNIEFVQSGDTFRIEINASQRFTYGPFTPGTKGSFGGSDNALRIYEGANKDNQLAVFRGVDSVRDLSVKLLKKIRTEDGQRKHVLNADGSESESVLNIGEDWVEV